MSALVMAALRAIVMKLTSEQAIEFALGLLIDVAAKHVKDPAVSAAILKVKDLLATPGK